LCFFGGVDFVAILRLFLDAQASPTWGGDEVRAVFRRKRRRKSLGRHFVVYFFVAVE